MSLPQELNREGEKYTWKPLLTATGWFGLLLAVTQALRVVIYQLLYRLLPLLGIEKTNIFWDFLSMGAMALTGVLLLLVLQPHAGQLGLDWQRASRLERRITAAGGAFLLVMAAINVWLDPAQLAPVLHGCLITPLFEELIFRGWGWGRIDVAMPKRGRGWGTLIVVTFLFGLWHLGYTDVISLRMAAHPENSAPLSLVMEMKVAIGLVVGLLVGLVRRPSQSVSGALVLHALWNLFAK